MKACQNKNMGILFIF